MTHFSNVFGNIAGTQARTTLKIRYPSGDGRLPATIATISFVCPYLKRSSPNNQTVSKWRRFSYFSTFQAQSKLPGFQKVAIPVETHHSLAVRFGFGSHVHESRDTVPKRVLYRAQWRSIQKHCRKQRLATLSTEKRCQTAELAIESCW